MASPKDVIAAAIGKLEAEKQRKIDAGEAVRVSLDGLIVIGVPGEEDAVAEAQAAKIAKLRAAGETRPIVFDPEELAVIITGVPRRGRDTPDLPVPVHKASKPDKEELRRSEGHAARLPEGHPGRASFAPPVPESPPSDPIPISVQIRAPDEREPAGVIARGFYRFTPTRVRVYDERGDLLGGADLRPGDDVEIAAKKLLREKHSAGGFYGRINYPRGSLH